MIAHASPGKPPVLAGLPGLRLPDVGASILVAVSGGLDSMVLLHVLKSLAGERRWALAVAHFNHRLRGRASNADEVLVRKTAAAMKLPFISLKADVGRSAREQKVSIEMAARQMRHAFLARTARECGFRTIALAHHADDQVELFFLRLMRGAGAGLGGMHWRSPSPADRRVSLVRPLLNIPRAALEQFAHANQIHFREDATNLSVDLLRNRIRQELLPLLRKHYQPGLNKTILRLMDIAGAESALSVDVARAWLGKPESASTWRGDRGPWKGIARIRFDDLPKAVQRQVLRLQLIELGVTVDFDLIELLRVSPDKTVTVAATSLISRDTAGCVSRSEPGPAVFNNRRVTAKLDKSGQIDFGGVNLKWRLEKWREKFIRELRRKQGTEYFDADKAGEEIVLRHWRTGDRFRPIGLAADAKLQDLFINRKIPRKQRHQRVIAEAGGRIFWVEGLRIAEDFKLTKSTRRVLIWEWRRP